MSDFNTLSVDKEKGTVSGRRDPEKEFQLLEKLGEGYSPSPPLQMTSKRSINIQLFRSPSKLMQPERIPLETSTRAPPPPPKSLPWLPLVLKWVNGDRWCSSICFYLFIFPLGLVLCSPRALSTSVAWAVTNRSYGSVRVLLFPPPLRSRAHRTVASGNCSLSLARVLRLALGWFPRAGVEGAPSRVGQNHRWAPLGLFSSLNPFFLPSLVRSLRSLRLPSLSLSFYVIT
jgi:hypothetical protein